MGKAPLKPPSRALSVRVKSAKSRTPASARWLVRQLNDPYVTAARQQGWRSRAAFKLLELDDKFHLIQNGARVLDLGAAPGGVDTGCGQARRCLRPGGGPAAH